MNRMPHTSKILAVAVALSTFVVFAVVTMAAQ